MKSPLRDSIVPLLSTALAALLVAGCSEGSTQPDPTDTNKDAVVMTFDMETVAGASRFILDSTATSPGGVPFKVTKFRFFVSQFALLDRNNVPVPVAMVDESGKELKYNLALVDYEAPASTTLRVLAPKGSYNGLAFSIGVPVVGSKGDSLNHADASQQTAPLDVDNDMYWGWNPGYIFLKIEGRSQIKGEWQSFFYHMGDDSRMAHIALSSPITVDAGAKRTLKVDIDRLFVTPSGTMSPNIGGGSTDRMAHMGALVDTVANNVAKSGFITLKQ
jgi:hypothetical protein